MVISVEQIRYNVKYALARGLPEATQQLPQLFPITIVAGGPSAKKAIMKAPVMAVNGALQLFIKEGGYPTFWAGCDPWLSLPPMLKNAPKETLYFVCSRCHPDTFDMLSGRNIVLWHLNESATEHLLIDKLKVQTAVSVTICAMGLSHLLGFSKIETWGWDGCHMDNDAYAYDQVPTGTRERVSVGSIDGPSFETTGTWLFEANDANFVLRNAPFSVTVHGGGMFGAILENNGLARVA